MHRAEEALPGFPARLRHRREDSSFLSVKLSHWHRPPCGRTPSSRRPAEPYAALFSRSGRGSSQTNARHRLIERIPARGNFAGRSPATLSRKSALRPM